MEDKLAALEMELNDCALPLLVSCILRHEVSLPFRKASPSLQEGIVCATALEDGFAGIDVAVLVGARPRGPGMLRKDLLIANAAIFKSQGQALAKYAAASVRVLVVGNPCNTNALITSTYAAGINPDQITALTRLDQNRCSGMIASKLGVPVRDVGGVIIWGNHSATQVPDATFATTMQNGSSDVVGVASQVDPEWLSGELVSSVQQRGKAVIDKRGSSSAGSAANSICDHLRDWFRGAAGRNVSMVVSTSGQYGVPSGLFVSLPVKCQGAWQYKVNEDVPMSDEIKALFDASVEELQQERAAVL